MRISILIQWMVVCFCVSCGEIKSVSHEGNDGENYERIFDEKTPLNVKIVNSVYITYSGFKPGKVTTPDWEIELIVPQSWIDKKITTMKLKKVEDESDFAYKFIKDQIENRVCHWYSPKDISNYNCYYFYPTSVPYSHLLVDKNPVGSNRFRVYLSKH